MGEGSTSPTISRPSRLPTLPTPDGKGLHFMDKLITTAALMIYGLALIGIIAHAVKKWLMREISYSVFAYLFTVDQRGSALTLFLVLGAAITAVGTGQLNNPHLFGDASAAFLIGFAFDSLIYPANSKAGSVA